MPRFCSIIENQDYRVGCTGQTVWVLDTNDTVIAKFKDLIYVSKLAISPLGNMFVAKSTDGRLAVYSLETLLLIRKIRFSKVKYSQDDGFCFSSDGRYFLNVERQGDDLHSAISIYDTSDFSLISRIFLGENMMIQHIQQVNGEYYVLGFMRGDDKVITYNFVAKFIDNAICDIKKITENESEFYYRYLYQTVFGLWIDEGQKTKVVHTLEELWAFYRCQ